VLSQPPSVRSFHSKAFLLLSRMPYVQFYCLICGCWASGQKFWWMTCYMGFKVVLIRTN
jgi:hypothetical protein